jgi:hypothetical protein
MALTQEEALDRANDGASAIDNAALRLAAPMVVAGAGAIVATAAGIGSVIFLALGLKAPPHSALLYPLLDGMPETQNFRL